ncbi:TetR/AcrR family transcriptional regulator [Actinomadura harenae]|uniref:TetR/AcrR family transcriptional regulator n=1 Tax=Actinomadura harenae TaxID=2483351 RepID=A0A3M2LIZ8_9ACTN|nr:TetR/AcrR family transcriptional regulator [Actinomadura harenae]RMI36503.1 TetR/AcrR family transcriptional regulator [Actinomadura harenae]
MEPVTPPSRPAGTPSPTVTPGPGSAPGPGPDPVPASDPARPDARTRILDAAEELFAEGGYEGTSTARIARSADVPKGLVFHYFPQKMDVLVTLVAERIEVEQAAGAAGLEAVPGDPAGTLARLARGFPLHASPAMRRILFREADTHTTVRERLRLLNGEVVRRARLALEMALPGARGDQARLEVAAATFAAVLIYQEHLAQLSGHHLDPEAVAELIAHALGS